MNSPVSRVASRLMLATAALALIALVASEYGRNLKGEALGQLNNEAAEAFATVAQWRDQSIALESGIRNYLVQGDIRLKSLLDGEILKPDFINQTAELIDTELWQDLQILWHSRIADARFVINVIEYPDTVTSPFLEPGFSPGQYFLGGPQLTGEYRLYDVFANSLNALNQHLLKHFEDRRSQLQAGLSAAGWRSFALTILLLASATAWLILLFRGELSASEQDKRRSLEKLNAQLEGALADAEHAREAESRFLSNMSHEIRNPLNGVIGMLNELQHSSRLDDDDRATLAAARASSDQVLRIVNDILDLKKITEGKLELNIESVDLHKLARDTSPTAEKFAATKGIQYINNTPNPNSPRFVMLDLQRFTQVLFNLTANALKFTESGSVTFDGYYQEGQLILKITDTGIGMTPEQAQNLFKRFVQADSGISKKYGGTGLGLAITGELVELMGGTIDVQSEPGKGSVFTVSIPAPVDEERERRWRSGETRDADSASQQHVALSGLKILCVDDSSINLKVLSRPLQRAGATVEAVLSGAEALEQLDSNGFDLVITDISMPEMDGEALLEHIRERHPDLPVIALTGNVLQSDVQRYESLGFNGVLAKPLEVPLLLGKVSELLQR